MRLQIILVSGFNCALQSKSLRYKAEKRG